MSNSCDPMDCSLPCSSVHRNLQARILKWVAISFSRQFSWPRDWNRVSCTAGRFFTNWARREAHIINTVINSMAWVNKFNQLKCSFEIDILLPQSFKMKSFLLKEVNQLDQHGCKYYRGMFSWYSMQLKESESVSHSVMSCSLRPQPSSSVHGILQARIQECVTIACSRGLLDPGIKPRSPALQADSLPSLPSEPGLEEVEWVSESHSVMSNSLQPHGLYSPWNSPGQNTGMSSLSLLQGSSQPRDPIQVSCIAGRFFTSWATREAQEYWSG